MGVKSIFWTLCIVALVALGVWYDFSEPRDANFWIEQGTWVTGIGTLFLGIVALWGTALIDFLKRPQLNIIYHHQPPNCHKTEDQRGGNSYPVYIFRFKVINVGKTVAKDCQAVLEILAEVGGKGHVINPHKGYTPANILWGSGFYTDTIDIYPNRPYYCGLCRIPSAKFQNTYKTDDGYVDPTGLKFSLGLILEIHKGFKFFSQPNRLPAGNYQLTIAIYSSNVAPCKRTFTINWSGKWSEQIEIMRKEISIT